MITKRICLTIIITGAIALCTQAVSHPAHATVLMLALSLRTDPPLGAKRSHRNRA